MTKEEEVSIKDLKDDIPEDPEDAFKFALQTVADNCYEILAALEESEQSDTDCPVCGEKLIQELGTEGKVCPKCEA